MEDFDTKCQEQYNQKKDKTEIVSHIKESRYEKDSDEDSNSEEGTSKW